MDTWFERVLKDPATTVRRRPNDKSRYVVHSHSHGMTAVIDPGGQRVSVYADQTGNDLQPVWLQLDQLTRLTP